MDYKEEFTQLIEENRLDDARILGYILSWAFHWIGRGISGMDWMLC